jgi:hypothetical protein
MGSSEPPCRGAPGHAGARGPRVVRRGPRGARRWRTLPALPSRGARGHGVAASTNPPAEPRSSASRTGCVILAVHDEDHGGGRGRGRAPALRRALAGRDDRDPARAASRRRQARARARRREDAVAAEGQDDRPVPRVHRRHAAPLSEAAGDAALRHGPRARLHGRRPHAARTRRARPASPAARGLPDHRDAARRAGAGRLGLRRQAAVPGWRAPALALRDGARALARAVGRVRPRSVGPLAVPLAGAGVGRARRRAPAVAVRQPEDRRARARRHRRPVSSDAARAVRRDAGRAAAVRGRAPRGQGQGRARDPLPARPLPRRSQHRQRRRGQPRARQVHRRGRPRAPAPAARAAHRRRGLRG